MGYVEVKVWTPHSDVTHFEEDGSVLLGAARCQELPQLLQDIFLLWLNNIHRVDDPSGNLHNTGQYSRRSVGSGKLSDSGLRVSFVHVKDDGCPLASVIR